MNKNKFITAICVTVLFTTNFAFADSTTDSLLQVLARLISAQQAPKVQDVTPRCTYSQAGNLISVDPAGNPINTSGCPTQNTYNCNGQQIPNGQPCNTNSNYYQPSYYQQANQNQVVCTTTVNPYTGVSQQTCQPAQTIYNQPVLSTQAVQANVLGQLLGTFLSGRGSSNGGGGSLNSRGGGNSSGGNYNPQGQRSNMTEAQAAQKNFDKEQAQIDSDTAKANAMPDGPEKDAALAKLAQQQKDLDHSQDALDDGIINNKETPNSQGSLQPTSDTGNADDPLFNVPGDNTTSAQPSDTGDNSTYDPSTYGGDSGSGDSGGTSDNTFNYSANAGDDGSGLQQVDGGGDGGDNNSDGSNADGSTDSSTNYDPNSD